MFQPVCSLTGGDFGARLFDTYHAGRMTFQGSILSPNRLDLTTEEKNGYGGDP
jgi:hypothetical protein